jgi:hypothetical protein
MAATKDPPLSRPPAGRGMRYVLVFLLVILAGAGLWTWLTLAWAYSDGTRAGILQKFSHKGWICKTREGELAQYVIAGVSPQIWAFSVRDPAVGAQLEKVVGARVQLHYTEHAGVPSTCFADTRYFVDHVTVIEAVPSGSAAYPTAPLPAPPAAQPPAAQPPAAQPPAAQPPVAPPAPAPQTTQPAQT